ncbi:MAG: hypothetical protein GX801_04865 [Fibrobacter sp.]|nr:hypothetical protein [Fibrobacter sp.]
MNSRFFIFTLLLPLFCWAASSKVFELLPVEDELVDSIAISILQQNYAVAERQGARLFSINPQAGANFWALAKLANYNDLGDTNKVYEAKLLLDTLEFSKEEWEGLRLFQVGFIEGLLGNGMRAATRTRAAAKIFKPLDNSEAQAFYFIYAFYMEALSAWIPGVSDKRPEMLIELEKITHNSVRFGSVIGSATVWMYFGRKEYDKALNLVDALLKKSPQNPAFLQMRADMLFRLEEYDAAAEIYEKSATYYERKAPKSLRWWCAAGNLARIYQENDKKELSQRWIDHFSSPEFQKIKKWMPPSLMKDLKRRKLL